MRGDVFIAFFSKGLISENFNLVGNMLVEASYYIHKIRRMEYVEHLVLKFL